MRRAVTYGDLEDTLRSFGFNVKEVPSSHYAFNHPNSKAVVLLPLYERKKPASQIHYAMVRSTLDGFGFLDRDEFDDIVRNHGRAAS
jgi:hypothetical protein